MSATEGLAERLPTTEGYSTAADLLRASVRFLFDEIGDPGAIALHMHHPGEAEDDEADVIVDLNRMSVVIDAANSESSFYTIDGRLDPPINNRERVICTDARRRSPAPEPTRRRRLRRSILHHDNKPAVPPLEDTVEYDFRDSHEINSNQVRDLFTWIAGAQLVGQEVVVVGEAS